MRRFVFLLLAGATLFFNACINEEEFVTDGSIALEFSVDTLTFDTVFTEVGSATRSFKVYNPGNQALKIGRIYLEDGAGSRFRINVDGIPGDEIEETIIYAGDSIYVFAEVTVDPNQPVSVSPFVINENLVFETNDQQQRVVLEAWGQNANYFPARGADGGVVRLSCDLGELNFDDPKPYVFYGVVFIDSCIVNFPPGARVYVHGGITRNELFGTYNDGLIITQRRGTIRARGTAENPVIFQGDRLEEAFREQDGQWTGIVFGPGSAGNLLEYTTVKNSIFGTYVDSAAVVNMNNVQIYNTSSSGIIAVHSRIRASNILVYNNGGNSAQLVHGGDYDFDYATLASYGVDASALGMSNFICYDDPFTCQRFNIYRLNAQFRNSILFGSKNDQLVFSDATAGEEEDLFNVRMENCVVGVDELLEEFDGLYANFFDEICLDCVQATRQDPLFIDPNEDDYHLDSLSVALGIGQPIRAPLPIAIDLDGKIRDPETPDAGCYER